jgi:hypothetical protein
MGVTEMIKIIEHEHSVQTVVLGFDHQPYSSNVSRLPEAVANASFAGFSNFPFDLDVREIDWGLDFQDQTRYSR